VADANFGLIEPDTLGHAIPCIRLNVREVTLAAATMFEDLKTSKSRNSSQRLWCHNVSGRRRNLRRI
jgi:hypothetical protein